MKKALSVFMAAAMMTAFSTSAFAVSPEKSLGESVAFSSGNSDTAVTPRLSKTTVSKNLTKDTWTLLYTDNNWLDTRAMVTNDDANPGSVIIRVVVRDGTQKEILDTTNAITVGSTYRSPIIGSSYDEYLVYAKAVTKKGTYKFTYDDI